MLSDELHPLYLQSGVLEQIKNQLELAGFIQLQKILSTKKLLEVQSFFKEGYINSLPDSHHYTNFKKSEISEEFSELLSQLLGRYVEIKTLELRSYKKGDYTLLHDEKIGKKSNLFILDLTENWSEDAGGYEVVVQNEDLIIPVQGNSLSIVFNVDKNYTKYVNCLAENDEKLVVIGTFI